jgi:asparagine synthase (glutamine-hydrolysing)
VKGKIWAFASEPQAVLLAEGVPRKINEGRIADFLESYLECIDYTETFFEHVFRLPPAHSLIVDAGGMTSQRYWTLTPGPELQLPSDEAYAEAFRNVFADAVRCRLRCNGPVGSMLSGGMDSGSVVGVATRLLEGEERGPLHTFSAVGPDAETCVETRTIHQSLTLPGLEPHLVNHAQLDDWVDDLIPLTRESAEPFDAHMVLPRAMYLSAQRAGLSVVLDGAAGDVVLTGGSQLARLLRRGRLWQAWREARGLESFYGVGRGTSVMIGGLREAFAPAWMRRIRERWRVARDHIPKGTILDRDFAQRIGLAVRATGCRDLSSVVTTNQATQRARTITATPLTVGRERYDRVASASGIEPRDPFMDIRVVKFCLSLPQHQVERDGWRKIVLRRAMVGMLPEEVRWRRGKEHLGGDFIKAMLARRPGWAAAACEARAVLSAWLHASEASLEAPLDDATALNYNNALVLALADWLSDLGAHIENLGSQK